MNNQEILEALKKSVAMPPVLCMNERSVIFVDYADGHGEAKPQVNNWFRCPCCSSIVVDSIATVDFSDCFSSQELEKLWQIFGEIPIDNADAILEEFLGFPEGTDRIEIWHWFDENYPEGVAVLMNGGKHGN